jgi:predicted alpha/beta hydrolase family esterase
MIAGMRTAIILHGKPTKEEFYALDTLNMSNRHWLPWLQAQLIKQDVHAYTPDMPKPFAPVWDDWVREIERYDITTQTMLVGHSAGAGFWLRYVSEHPGVEVAKLILVAPWIDPDGDETGRFMDFEIDPEIVKRAGKVTIFHSDNDMGNVHKSVATIKERLKEVEYKEFSGFGHFTEQHMGTCEFSELLEVAVRE